MNGSDLENVSLPDSLPNAQQAEKSVIGSVLADSSLLPEVIEKIRPEYFYNETNRKVFRTIFDMFSLGESVDVVAVMVETVKRRIFPDERTAKMYFADVGETLPTAEHSKTYCEIITDKYLLRTLSTVAREILRDVESADCDSGLILDSAEKKIYDIRKGKDIMGLSPLSDAILQAYDHLGKIAGEDREKYIGARTGFTSLDTITSGLNKSDLIILAARPGMGKTSFAMNIAMNVARRTEKDVAVFSLEMSKEQLATRLLSTDSLVDTKSLMSGRIKDDEWVRLASSAGYLSAMPIYIDDTAGNITVQQMNAKLRRLKNLGLVIIDYLQLISMPFHTDNRAVAVGEITRQLKMMAKELDVPVILLSQLSRAVESRPSKRPLLSDLRDSGSIEQDADIVLFLYRESYYVKDCERANSAECIVAKNRHGETGSVELVWDGKYTRFANPDYQEDFV